MSAFLSLPQIVERRYVDSRSTRAFRNRGRFVNRMDRNDDCASVVRRKWGNVRAVDRMSYGAYRFIPQKQKGR